MMHWQKNSVASVKASLIAFCESVNKPVDKGDPVDMLC